MEHPKHHIRPTFVVVALAFISMPLLWLVELFISDHPRRRVPHHRIEDDGRD